ncbi:FliH/SctL family protein [Acidipila rosea]|uniref:Flagellar assembly protein FliH n=1 Tax=Acidipila rosea TaxID=768535 RepID=A0A4R1L9N5_9BACT|nr:FliH/SctL family protein [Acidipila rosea]TCK75076.1 flagellar assembly protein FliH [Acidipila rosea]
MPATPNYKIEPLQYAPWQTTEEGAIPLPPPQEGLVAERPRDPVNELSVERINERIRELERQLAEREELAARQIAEAKTTALRQAQEAQQSETHALQTRIANQVTGAVQRFEAQCESYFAQVEHEVVRLALSIASRVLHRESQIDPLLLSGAVRVALGQLSESTDVTLRVPAADLSLWTEMLRHIPNLPLHPQLVADGSLETGECEIETKMGSIDLGVKAQLGEIERGFFDLLDRRQQLTGKKRAGAGPEA